MDVSAFEQGYRDTLEKIAQDESLSDALSKSQRRVIGTAAVGAALGGVAGLAAGRRSMAQIGGMSRLQKLMPQLPKPSIAENIAGGAFTGGVLGVIGSGIYEGLSPNGYSAVRARITDHLISNDDKKVANL